MVEAAPATVVTGAPVVVDPAPVVPVVPVVVPDVCGTEVLVSLEHAARNAEIASAPPPASSDRREKPKMPGSTGGIDSSWW